MNVEKIKLVGHGCIIITWQVATFDLFANEILHSKNVPTAALQLESPKNTHIAIYRLLRFMGIYFAQTLAQVTFTTCFSQVKDSTSFV